MFLKKGMKVKVRVGKDKGKTGEIIEIDSFEVLLRATSVLLWVLSQRQRVHCVYV